MSGMTAWQFADPIFFFLIPCLGIVVYVALVGRRQERLRFSDVGLAEAAQGGRGRAFRLIPLGLRTAVLFLVIVALARPQGGSKGQDVLSEGVDIMLVADTSGSMEAMDFTLGGKRVTRLDVAKKVIRDFISGRVNDRIGLVVFGEEAFVQCPTTLDYGILINTLDAVKLKMAGDGTAIGSALGTAVRSLRALPGTSKIIILLTDGKNTTGILDPQQGARAAATYGIKVYTIGVGTEGEAPFLTRGLFGGEQFVYQKVEMDEEALRAIAEATGARYFRADSSESLAQIFRLIDEMEKTKVEVREWVDYEELYRAVLLPALLLLILELVLRATWLRTLPG
jgi:Ca-activated chloride channel family protein